MTRLETVGRPFSELLGKESSLNSSAAAELAEVAMRYSDAYAAYICDENGDGIDNAGEKISIAQTDYCEQICNAEDISYVSGMFAVSMADADYSLVYAPLGINMISKVYNMRKQEQLEVKADTDLLTGLNNKLATERKIKEYIKKNPNSQSMMFVLDIDNFKKINDTMGHAFGDEFIIFLKGIRDTESIKKEAKKWKISLKTLKRERHRTCF